jgi:hypothetical protein
MLIPSSQYALVFQVVFFLWDRKENVLGRGRCMGILGDQMQGKVKNHSLDKVG